MPTVLALAAAIAVAVLLHLTTTFAQARGRARAAEGARPSEASGAILGSIFALLGLLLAFTFSSAAGRLDARRALIVTEANALGTAWQRLDLVRAEAQPALRAALRDYGELRARLYRDLADRPRAAADMDSAAALAARTWRVAIDATAGPGQESVRTLVLPALNDAFDAGTTRNVAIETHVPVVVVVMLAVLAFGCAYLSGLRMGLAGDTDRRFPLAFAIATAMVGWLIVDFEFPRYGLVRLDAAHATLEAVVRAMR